MNKVQENIELIRREKGIKQSTMANMLNISQSTYSQYFSRNDDIRYGLISQIAEKLGVTVIDIITYPEKWVPLSSMRHNECELCKQKDAIIKNLNNYIDVLEEKLNLKK